MRAIILVCFVQMQYWCIIKSCLMLSIMLLGDIHLVRCLTSADA